MGRVANRIADGKFKVDGVEYLVAKNNGPNALHGGLHAIDKVVWEARIHEDGQSVTFAYCSPHMENGYPGDEWQNT